MDKPARRYFKDAFYADQAAGLLRRIVAARRGALGRDHGEALHDWRVLCRRLIEFTGLWAARAVRQQVMPLAEPWIEATNAARDAEVELAMITSLKAGASARVSIDLARLESAVAPVVRRENAALEAFLKNPARANEERRLESLLDGLPRFPVVPARFPGRLRRAIERFRDLESRRAASIKDLHKFRLAAKRVRYGFEPLAPLAPALRPVLAELTALQRALGEHRDWTRLAEKSRELDLGGPTIRLMRRQAEKHLAGRPRQLRETDKFLAAGWTPPPLTPRMLRRRVRALPEAGEPPVRNALALAANLRKCRKRADGSSGLIHPLRATLSLYDEAGAHDPRALAATLIAGALAGCAPISEDVLAKHFEAEVIGAVMALDPGEEPAEDHRARLQAGPQWATQVALALELETLRFTFYAERPERERRAAATRLQTLLPLFPESDGLARQARRLLEVRMDRSDRTDPSDKKKE